MSTEEELHQVLAVLQETPNGWLLSEGLEDLAGGAIVDSCADTVSDDASDAESIAQIVAKRPALNN